DIFAIGNLLQVIRDVADLDAVEIKDLATRQNSRNDLVLLRGSQDKNCVRRRLFQGFQKRVESRVREHMHLVDDVHLEFSELGWVANLVNQVADIFNGVV